MGQRQFGINYEDFERLREGMQQFGDDAKGVVNETFHTQVGPLIYQRIAPLVPISNRQWKTHTYHAAENDWSKFKTDTDLAVTVTTKPSYRYLYFPDDGSNTKRHAGMQEFFPRGAEAAAPEIVDLCLDNLEKKLQEDLND